LLANKFWLKEEEIVEVYEVSLFASNISMERLIFNENQEDEEEEDNYKEENKTEYLTEHQILKKEEDAS